MFSCVYGKSRLGGFQPSLLQFQSSINVSVCFSICKPYNKPCQNAKQIKETTRLQRSSLQYESVSRHRPETKESISRKICSKQYPFEADDTCKQILLRFFQENRRGDCSRVKGTQTAVSRQNIAAAHSHKPRPIARFRKKRLEYLTNAPEFFQDL